MKRLILLWFFFILASFGTALAQDWHTTPDKWQEGRIFHSKFENDFEGRIRISHTQLDKKILEKIEKEKNYSPNKAYWFVVDSPDTMKPGPWSTEIRVFNERDSIIKIELVDHAATYVTSIRWVNEKLLYVQLWWGRILGTYFIFDVEKEKIVIKEMVYDGDIAFEQWQQNKRK
jgi:hypothetical protein